MFAGGAHGIGRRAREIRGPKRRAAGRRPRGTLRRGRAARESAATKPGRASRIRRTGPRGVDPRCEATMRSRRRRSARARAASAARARRSTRLRAPSSSARDRAGLVMIGPRARFAFARPLSLRPKISSARRVDNRTLPYQFLTADRYRIVTAGGRAHALTRLGSAAKAPAEVGQMKRTLVVLGWSLCSLASMQRFHGRESNLLFERAAHRWGPRLSLAVHAEQSSAGLSVTTLAAQGALCPPGRLAAADEHHQCVGKPRFRTTAGPRTGSGGPSAAPVPHEPGEPPEAAHVVDTGTPPEWNSPGADDLARAASPAADRTARAKLGGSPRARGPSHVRRPAR